VYFYNKFILFHMVLTEDHVCTVANLIVMNKKHTPLRYPVDPKCIEPGQMQLCL
jgi:hypothetical protein